jgi:hypothetical protein
MRTPTTKHRARGRLTCIEFCANDVPLDSDDDGGPTAL